MNRCLDVDALVTIAAALEWNQREALRHLTECDACQLQLDELATLHEVLEMEIAPRAGYTDQVVREFGRERTSRSAGRHFGLLGVINPILAGATASVAILLASAAYPAVQTPSSVLLASLVVVGATLWWNWTRVGAPVLRPPSGWPGGTDPD